MKHDEDSDTFVISLSGREFAGARRILDRIVHAGDRRDIVAGAEGTSPQVRAFNGPGHSVEDGSRKTSLKDQLLFGGRFFTNSSNTAGWIGRSKRRPATGG